jgi:predicted enzyme related to lactoylglutathione lyase
MFPNDPGRPPGTVSGIVLYVEDVVLAANEITRRGGRIVDPAEKTDYGALFATVADPEGNEFLLTQQ